jgi:hypothetical protein
MSVAEMKLAAIKEIVELEDERAVKVMLEFLTKLSEQKDEKKNSVIDLFNEVNEKYGNVLRRLAE